MTTTHIMHPGLLTKVDTSSRCAIGTPWTDQTNWKRYCYVYNAGADSWAIGVPVGVFLTSSGWGECSVTTGTKLLHVDGGANDPAVIAGIGLSTIATTEFGWIQVGGITNYMVTDGTINASVAGMVHDDGVAVVASTEPMAHGIMCVGITADAAALSSNALLLNCAFDHH